MYRLITKDSFINFLIIFAIIFIGYSLNKKFEIEFADLLTIFVIYSIAISLYFISALLGFKPGEDFLTLYLFAFYGWLEINHIQVFADFFFVLGLYYLLSVVNSDIEMKTIYYARFAVFFAISSLINLSYLPFALTLIFLLFLLQNINKIGAVIFGYLVVFGIFYALKFIFTNSLEISLELSSLNKQYKVLEIIILIIEILTILAALTIAGKLEVRTRRTATALIVFILTFILLQIFEKIEVNLAQIASLSVLFSLTIIRAKITVKRKSLILLTYLFSSVIAFLSLNYQAIFSFLKALI